MTRITAAELDALQELCEKATLGPWEQGPSINTDSIYVTTAPNTADTMEERGELWITDICTLFTANENQDEFEANARLVAASRSALPSLIARVRELEGALEYLTDPIHYENSREARVRVILNDDDYEMWCVHRYAKQALEGGSDE